MRYLLILAAFFLLSACAPEGTSDHDSAGTFIVGKASGSGTIVVIEELGGSEASPQQAVDTWESQVSIHRGECYSLHVAGQGLVEASIQIPGFLTWRGGDIDSFFIRACYYLPR